MDSEFHLEGTVLWSYDYEIDRYHPIDKITTGFLSASPLHDHKGYIALTSAAIIIEGQSYNENLTIALTSLNQLYLGYDDLYSSLSYKSPGTFWQPLRIEYYINQNQLQKVYLIIDYNGLFSANKKWYKMLTQMLSEQQHHPK